jgi:hypothetical protein
VVSALQIRAGSFRKSKGIFPLTDRKTYNKIANVSIKLMITLEAAKIKEREEYVRYH